MTSRTIFPFDFSPVNTVGNSSSYTVPSGKYAKATITLDVSAYVSNITGGAVGAYDTSINNDSNSATIEVWLDEGDALTKTTSVASGTDTASSSPFVSFLSDKSTATVNVNGSSIAEVNASATGTAASNSTTSVTISGDANVRWFIQEYNKLT